MLTAHVLKVLFIHLPWHVDDAAGMACDRDNDDIKFHAARFAAPDGKAAKRVAHRKGVQ